MAQSNTLRRAAALIHSELDRYFQEEFESDSSEETVSLFEPYLLLSGLAVETALKAVVVARDPALIGEFQLEKTFPAVHKVVALAVKVLGSLSAGERDLLSRLETAVVWSGRYPVPKRAPGGSFAGASWHSDDRESIGALYVRVDDAFAEALKTLGR